MDIAKKWAYDLRIVLNYGLLLWNQLISNGINSRISSILILQIKIDK